MIRCLIFVAGLCIAASAGAQTAKPSAKTAPKHYEQEQASPLIAPDKAIETPAKDALAPHALPPSKAEKPVAPPPKDPVQGTIQITTRNCREVQ